eukprot:357581-Chlamydomonas_euryale.AAC.3
MPGSGTLSAIGQDGPVLERAGITNSSSINVKTISSTGHNLTSCRIRLSGFEDAFGPLCTSE